MSQTIRIGDGAVLDQVLSKKRAWINTLNDRDLDRLSKEIDDLIYTGQMMADQGASFSSKRTLTIGNNKVILIAKFGQSSFWRRVIGVFGG